MLPSPAFTRERGHISRPWLKKRDGYQVWLFPGPRRQFALLGVHGQAVFVDSEARLVLAHTAARKLPRDPGAIELSCMWNALVKKFAGS